MHISTKIQDIIAHARTLTTSERQALRLELIKVAAGIGVPIPTWTPRSTASRLRWPLVGGDGLIVVPDMTVESEIYQRQWQASDVVVWIYVLGCPGIQELASLLGLPLFKVGTTAGRIQDRLSELGRDSYGNCYRTTTGFVRDSGFGPGLWVAEQTPITINLSPLSPVHPSARGIGVRLPLGMSAAAFERQFATEISGAAFSKLIASPAGHALCAERGVDSTRCRRVTEYRFGADTRPSSEEEFTVFRPRADANRLAVIAEQIVVRHVMRHGQ